MTISISTRTAVCEDENKHLWIDCKRDGEFFRGYHFILRKQKDKYDSGYFFTTDDGFEYKICDEKMKAIITETVKDFYKIYHKNRSKVVDDDKKACEVIAQSIEKEEKPKQQERIESLARILLYKVNASMQQNNIVDKYRKLYDFSENLPIISDVKDSKQISNNKAELLKMQLDNINCKANLNADNMQDYFQLQSKIEKTKNNIVTNEKNIKRKKTIREQQNQQDLRNVVNNDVRKTNIMLQKLIFDQEKTTYKHINNNDYQSRFNDRYNKSKCLFIDIKVPTTQKAQLLIDLTLNNENGEQLFALKIEKTTKNKCNVVLSDKKNGIKYTQTMRVGDIENMISKDTKKSITNCINLFYKWLSSRFGVDIDSNKKKRTPLVFNVENIEKEISGNVHYPKQQQGYNSHNNGEYIVMYEKHTPLCPCEKHNAIEKQGSMLTTTETLLYYGGDEGAEREYREKMFNKYCEMNKVFKKLNEQENSFGPIVIHNANAYGRKAQVNRWKRKQQINLSSTTTNTQIQSNIANAGVYNNKIQNSLTIKNNATDKNLNTGNAVNGCCSSCCYFSNNVDSNKPDKQDEINLAKNIKQLDPNVHESIVHKKTIENKQSGCIKCCSGAQDENELNITNKDNHHFDINANLSGIQIDESVLKSIPYKNVIGNSMFTEYNIDSINKKRKDKGAQDENKLNITNKNNCHFDINANLSEIQIDESVLKSIPYKNAIGNSMLPKYNTKNGINKKRKDDINKK